MFAGSGPSPAQVAEARLSARSTMQTFALSVAVLHTAPYVLDYLQQLFK